MPGAGRAGLAPDRVRSLNGGQVETTTLVECLAVDHAALMRATVPDLSPERLAALESLGSAGITRRMAAAADALLVHYGPDHSQLLAAHPSDTVRGWAAFMIGRTPDIDLEERLKRIRVFADDHHFGVREWAWLAIRPQIASAIEDAVGLLAPWTSEASPSLRRFATEATRPRGVWAAHIPELKRNPDLGLPLLEPLRADPARYVQDSVANWINDAAKDRADWARDLCTRWLAESSSPDTARICRRATRSI